MTETPIQKARRLVTEAMGAVNALNQSLTESQLHECEHLLGYAHDGLGSADGYLETVARRLEGEG